MNKITTIGDLFDMEKQVMAFYDAVPTGLRGPAYEIVMAYRALQVELSNLIARNRHIALEDLPALDRQERLSPPEAAILMQMKGVFSRDVENIDQAESLAEILQAVGLTLLPKEGNRGG